MPYAFLQRLSHPIALAIHQREGSLKCARTRRLGMGCCEIRVGIRIRHVRRLVGGLVRVGVRVFSRCWWRGRCIHRLSRIYTLCGRWGMSIYVTWPSFRYGPAIISIVPSLMKLLNVIGLLGASTSEHNEHRYKVPQHTSLSPVKSPSTSSSSSSSPTLPSPPSLSFWRP